MRRLVPHPRSLLLALGLGVLVLAGLPSAAHADEDDWSVSRYRLTAAAAPDGAVDVTVDLTFDFADTPGHGPYVTLPLLQEVEGDPDHYRRFAVTDVRASSPSGAPAAVQAETEGRALAIRVGDEDIEVEGRQDYTLSYRIRGVVNPAVGTPSQDEIFWNVVGPQWEVPLDDVGVRLTGPAAVARAACFAGEVGSSDPCDDVSTSGPTATFLQGRVEPGTGLTVLAAWPVGTFVGAEPELVPRRHLGNTFGLDPLTGGLAGAVALLGVGALLRHARRRGRDEQFVGLTPGLAPASADGTAATAPADRRAPVAVQFTPPAGVRPGELGTLVDEVAHPADVTATVVDLAVRGHLRIEETGGPGPADAGKGARGGAPERTWRLVRLPGQSAGEPLLGYEQLILDKLFADGDEVALDDLGASFTGALAETQQQLYAAVTERGWFVANPAAVRRRWYGIGAAVVVAGLALAAGLALTLGWGLVGVAVVVVGVATLVLASRMPARTAPGSAVLAQALGFRLYLETAEGDQLRFEEGEDLFSRYLPHAIAFGLAERWATVFADLARQGRAVPEPSWYVGQQAAFLAGAGGSGSPLGAFSQAATASMTAATYRSGGGSGFAGGVAGGGVGGGGGGGW